MRTDCLIHRADSSRSAFQSTNGPMKGEVFILHLIFPVEKRLRLDKTRVFLAFKLGSRTPKPISSDTANEADLFFSITINNTPNHDIFAVVSSKEKATA